MASSFMNKSLQYGLLFGLLYVAYSLYAYLFDLELFANFIAGIVIWVIGVVVLVLAVREVRKLQGEAITFRTAFATFIIAALAGLLINLVFTQILFGLVDPEAAERVNEIVTNQAYQNMKRFGAGDEQISEAMKEMENNNQFDLVSQLRGLLFGGLFYAVIGLIVAAIMKRSEP